MPLFLVLMLFDSCTCSTKKGAVTCAAPLPFDTMYKAEKINLCKITIASATFARLSAIYAFKLTDCA